MVDFTRNYSATHAKRRWNYFITKDGWNPNEPLSRAQFEPEPLFMGQNPQQPHWKHANVLTPSAEGT
ncbi:chitin-binding protein, partial [Sodalis-like symbiont of Bactericera trigonica]